MSVVPVDQADRKPLNDIVIWCGDFNYRINGVVGAVKAAMKQNMYEVLHSNDQFSIERKIGRIS